MEARHGVARAEAEAAAGARAEEASAAWHGGDGEGWPEARSTEARGGSKFWQPDGVEVTPRAFGSRGEQPPATI